MMNIIYQTAEILATVIEALLLFWASTEMVGSRFEKKKQIISVLICTAAYTVIITIMNQWELFSFITLSTAILITFVGVLIITKGDFINKMTATMLSWFVISATEYSLSYGIFMLLGKSFDISKGLSMILSLGKARLLYLTALKISQIIIFLFLRKLFPKLQLLRKSEIYIVFAITLLSYIIMSTITQMLLSDSILTLQMAVIFSLIFIILTIVITLFATMTNAKFQNEKREKQLMALTNEMIEKNYTVMRNTQNEVRRQVHDFKNHLRAVNGMLEEDSPAKEYVEDLLAESYNSAQFCRSGNDVIDSIINCKVNEAYEKHIDFKYNVILSTKLNVSSVDICAVLANQIDNALEAALKVAQLKERFVKVEITQKEAFVFFKVENSCSENPFNSKNELKTTKDNSNGMHGLGIKNIKETAEKYSGELKNEYNEGVFTSIAMLMNND